MQIDPLELPSLPIEEFRSLPRECVIYFAMSETNEILYIGRAFDMRERWRGHHLLEEFLSYIGVRLAWFVYTADKSKMPRLEKQLIAQFNPKLNFSKGGGKFNKRVVSKKTIGLIQKEVDFLLALSELTTRNESELIHEGISLLKAKYQYLLEDRTE